MIYIKTILFRTLYVVFALTFCVLCACRISPFQAKNEAANTAEEEWSVAAEEQAAIDPNEAREVLVKALTALCPYAPKEASFYWGTLKIPFCEYLSADERERVMSAVFYNMDYDILSEEIVDDSVLFEVSIANYDLPVIASEVASDYFAWFNSPSPPDADDQIPSDVIYNFIMKAKNATYDYIEQTVFISVTYQNGHWSVSTDEDGLNAMMGNIFNLTESEVSAEHEKDSHIVCSGI